MRLLFPLVVIVMPEKNKCKSRATLWREVASTINEGPKWISRSRRRAWRDRPAHKGFPAHPLRLSTPVQCVNSKFVDGSSLRCFETSVRGEASDERCNERCVALAGRWGRVGVLNGGRRRACKCCAAIETCDAAKGQMKLSLWCACHAGKAAWLMSVQVPLATLVN